MMKKMFCLLGTVVFFTCTAFCISFGGWTWIAEDSLINSLDYCISKNGSMITKETKISRNILEYRAICVCNPGYEYNYFTDNCEPEGSAANPE